MRLWKEQRTAVGDENVAPNIGKRSNEAIKVKSLNIEALKLRKAGNTAKKAKADVKVTDQSALVESLQTKVKGLEMKSEADELYIKQLKDKLKEFTEKSKKDDSNAKVLENQSNDLTQVKNHLFHLDLIENITSIDANFDPSISKPIKDPFEDRSYRILYKSIQAELQQSTRKLKSVCDENANLRFTQHILESKIEELKEALSIQTLKHEMLMTEKDEMHNQSMSQYQNLMENQIQTLQDKMTKGLSKSVETIKALKLQLEKKNGQ